MTAPRRNKIDTRALGLDLGLSLVRFVTGRENLHYGYWRPGVEVCAGNLLRAQEAYTEKIKSCFPAGRLRILDIGGGCGEFAKDLAKAGHDVEIVVPSDVLAARCRANAGPAVPVHMTRFEDFRAEPRFDLCLFSESLQYIPVAAALANAGNLLAQDGEIVISDCFRTGRFYEEFEDVGIVGGGHSLEEFRKALAAGGFETLHEEDITDAVAPSVDLEQNLYNMLGAALNRADRDLAVVYPFRRKMIKLALRAAVSRRRRARLERRLFGDSRNAEMFRRYNRYLIFRIKPPGSLAS